MYRNLFGLTLADEYEPWAEAELRRIDSYANLRAMALVRITRAAMQQVAYYRLEFHVDHDRCPKCGNFPNRSTYRFARSVCDACALAW